MTKNNTATKTATTAAKAAKAPAAAKAAKPAAAKAPAKPAKAAKVAKLPATGDRLNGNRKLKALIKPAAIAAKAGTWRHTLVSIALASKDTDTAKAALKADKTYGATHRMDFAWLVAQGFVAYA